jgi:hypothetical protein
MKTQPCAYKYFNKLTLTNLMIWKKIESMYEHLAYTFLNKTVCSKWYSPVGWL